MCRRWIPLGAATFLGRALSFYNPADRIPYTMQWSFNTQTMLPGQFLLEVGYLGTRSLKLMITRELDAIPNQFLSTSPVRDQKTIDFLTANVPNPFAGLLPGTSLNGNTIPAEPTASSLPQFTNVSMIDYQGWAWYNALQVRLERRFSRGFTALAGYSFSKTIDASAFQNAGDSAPTRRFLHGASRPLDAVVGGWQLSGAWQVNSGFPLTFGDVVFLGQLQDIKLSSDKRSVERWFNTDAGFVRDSAQQFSMHLRTFPFALEESERAASTRPTFRF